MKDERFQLRRKVEIFPLTPRNGSSANDELEASSALRKFGQQFPHESGRGIIGAGHAEEDLHRAGVILREPGAEAGFCFRSRNAGAA